MNITVLSKTPTQDNFWKRQHVGDTHEDSSDLSLFQSNPDHKFSRVVLEIGPISLNDFWS